MKDLYRHEYTGEVSPYRLSDDNPKNWVKVGPSAVFDGIATNGGGGPATGMFHKVSGRNKLIIALIFILGFWMVRSLVHH